MSEPTEYLADETLLMDEVNEEAPEIEDPGMYGLFDLPAAPPPPDLENQNEEGDGA